MDNILDEMIEVPAIDGRPNCDLSCHNYEGLMCDLENAIEHFQKYLDGKISEKQARSYIHNNWPELYAKFRK